MSYFSCFLCGTHTLLRKSHIRGALTTGHKWLFIVVDIDADGDGASYWISDVLEWRVNSKGTFEFSTEEGNPALIAGILGSWVSMNTVILDPL